MYKTILKFMNKIGAYIIITEKRLIIIYFSGEIDIDDLIYLQQFMHLDSSYDASFDVIIDFRDCIPIAEYGDINRYIEFMNDNIKYYSKRKGAYLTNKPVDVVATTLFALMPKKIPIETQIFSTVDAIAKWYYYKHIDSMFLESKLIQLKTQPNNVYTK